MLPQRCGERTNATQRDVRVGVGRVNHRLAKRQYPSRTFFCLSTSLSRNWLQLTTQSTLGEDEVLHSGKASERLFKKKRVPTKQLERDQHLEAGMRKQVLRRALRWAAGLIGLAVLGVVEQGLDWAFATLLGWAVG